MFFDSLYLSKRKVSSHCLKWLKNCMNEMLTDGKTTVLVEGDQGWPGKYLTYNQALAKTPGMVVYATTVLHIRRAIQFAKQHNIKISVVSSGHSFLGRCGDEGAMQISVVNMKDIQIDLDCPESPFGCITTQSGVTWGEAFREASILHRGATSTISKEDREKLTSLPHTWSESGLSLGGCQINEYSSFYEYEMTIPNVTYGVTYIGGSLIQEDLLSISTSDTFVKHYTKAYERSKIDPTYNLIGTATWVGGAVKDIPVDEVPVHPVTTDPTDRIHGVKEFHEDLARFSSGKYYNEAEPDMAPHRKKEFWSDSAYEKLVDIKKAWDPQNIFTCNQCIGSDWMRNEPVFG
ncbi:hypothetical protein EB796_002713 [Bugula neritina]|uniref:FAD-binding PCMH-type domain-containing protein n=1 Tax=Bugula neritina TaxID=10212 RepID=A0A7J7KJS3_BUGNE|nr:hypothetical protein EB796_002713 [Bugula neritina]